MGVGARGGGKSEAAKTKGIALMVDTPGVNGQIVAPTLALTKVIWGKMMADIPQHWIYQVRRADREIVLLNGVVVRFRSSDNPDSLRGWGGAWSLHDESQDQPDEALDIAWLSLRETDTPQLCEVGTAKDGMFHDRYDKLREQDSASVHHFSALDNPFIPQTVYEHAARDMDPRLYRQEVLAEWVGLADRVYEFYDAEVHARRWTKRAAVLADLYGIANGSEVATRQIDITEELTRKRFKVSSDVIIGLDFNIKPMVCAVYRVLQGPANVGHVFWLVDEVILDDKATAERMGKALRDSGYPNSLIVADASDNRAKHYRRSLEKLGHRVVWPARNNRNPHVKDRVASMSAVMRNVEGHVRWFVDPDNAPRIAKAIERHQRDHRGRPDKTSGYDHFCDAAGYPIVKLAPVALDAHRTVQGRHATA